MTLSIVLAFSALVAAQTAGPTTAETELLAIGAPGGFEVGYRARDETAQIVEIIRPPETVENWTTMITSMMLFHAAEKEDVGRFYEGWTARLRQSCPDLTHTPIRGAVDGRPALKSRISCPRLPKTGKPENMTAVLVEGEVNMMVVQVAFRRGMTAEDIAMADGVAASMRLCDERDLPACTAREPSGFVTAETK